MLHQHLHPLFFLNRIYCSRYYLPPLLPPEDLEVLLLLLGLAELLEEDRLELGLAEDLELDLELPILDLGEFLLELFGLAEDLELFLFDLAEDGLFLLLEFIVLLLLELFLVVPLTAFLRSFL